MRKPKIVSSAWFSGASLIALTLGSAVPGAVRAAEPVAAQPPVTALSEVIVTAQHRSENVQKAALAVDVVSTDKMQVMAANRATDLVTLVPSLQIGESGQGQQSLYLRGVGTFTANSYSDPAIAFNVDGIAIARPSSMSGVMYDLSRVEVVKGPQGTLYGRNATGGAINILPNLPKIGVTSEDLALTVGSYGEIHPEAAFNIGLTDTSAARLAFTYLRHDGYQTDGSGDADNYALRGQYLWKPNSDFSVRISGDVAHDGGRGPAGALVGVINPFTGATAVDPLPRDVGFEDPRITNLYQHQYSFLAGRDLEGIQGGLKADDTYWGLMSEIKWRSPIGTLVILPAYRESSLDDFSAGLGLAEIAMDKDRQTSVEVRLGNDDPGLVRWQVGGYYFDESIQTSYQFNLQAVSAIQNFHTGTTSGAGFAHITLAPVERFRISAGVRYTDDSKTFDGLSPVLVDICTVSSTIPACPGAPLMPNTSNYSQLANELQLFPIIPNTLYGSALPGAQNNIFALYNIGVNKSSNYSRLTYHGGLEFDVAKSSLLYASVDTGYHAGGFAFAEIKPTYGPETITAYSIGSKNRFFDNSLQLNLEAFYWQYRNQQISHSAIDTDGAQVFITDNAGASTIQGVEANLKYILPEGTVFNLDVQYLSAIYDNFSYNTPAGGTNAPPVTGCPYSQTSATFYTVKCTGKTLEQSPKWTGNVGLRHSFQLGSYKVIGDFETHFQTNSMVGFEQTAAELQHPYAESNLSVTLTRETAPWTATAFVNNIQDVRPLGQAYFNAVMGVYGASVGPPRIIGLRLAAHF